MGNSLINIVILYFCWTKPFSVSGISGTWIVQNNATKYFVSNKTTNFVEAQQICAILNASLPVLSSEDDWTFVTNWLLRNTTSETRFSFYVNAIRSDNNQFQEYGDGSRFPGAARWGPFQPDNQIPNEDCVSLRYTVDKYFIFDDFCNVNYSVMCQKKIAFEWSTWESWSSCSSSCQPSVRVRNRSCQAVLSTGINTCNFSSETTQMEPCNTHLCNETIILTSPCNATCNQSGFMEETTTCMHNQLLPEQCIDVTTSPCIGRCSNSRNDLLRRIASTQAPDSSASTLSASGQSLQDTSKTSMTDLFETSTSLSLEPASPENFLHGQDILIAICIGAGIFLFLVLLLVVALLKKKKKPFQEKRRELPTPPPPSLNRLSQHRPNFYSNPPDTTSSEPNQTEYENTNEPENKRNETLLEENDNFDGVYVTFNYVTESERQPKDEEITSQSEEVSKKDQVTTSDYVPMESIQACPSKQSSTRSSEENRRHSGGETRTLEFDYVTVPELMKEEKYSKLGKRQTDLVQWSDTYDIIVR